MGARTRHCTPGHLCGSPSGEWDACGVVSAATHVGEQAVLHPYGCSGDGIALALAPPAGKRLRESLPSPTHTIFHLASRTVSYAYVTLSRHSTHLRRVSHAAVAIVQVQSPTRDATLLLLLQVPPYDAAYYPTLYHIYIGRERQWRGATGTALVVCQAPAENTSPTHPFSG